MNLYLGQTVHSVEKGRFSADDQSIGAKSSPKQQWTSGLVDLLDSPSQVASRGLRATQSRFCGLDRYEHATQGDFSGACRRRFVVTRHGMAFVPEVDVSEARPWNPAPGPVTWP